MATRIFDLLLLSGQGVVLGGGCLVRRVGCDRD